MSFATKCKHLCLPECTCEDENFSDHEIAYREIMEKIEKIEANTKMKSNQETARLNEMCYIAKVLGQIVADEREENQRSFT